MALLKKKKSDPAAAPSAAPEGESPKKGGGMLVMLLAPVLVFGASFGTSTFLGTGGGASAPATTEAKPEPTAAKLAAEWHPEKPAKTVSLDIMAISAGPQGEVLRIGIAVEVWKDDAELDQPRLRDAFTTYLRALDADQLSDPAFHVRMKRALLHRARVVEGQDVVADILITDFLLTS
jgi:flagellar basal body-associated protein FliL